VRVYYSVDQSIHSRILIHGYGAHRLLAPEKNRQINIGRSRLKINSGTKNNIKKLRIKKILTLLIDMYFGAIGYDED